MSASSVINGVLLSPLFSFLDARMRRCSVVQQAWSTLGRDNFVEEEAALFDAKSFSVDVQVETDTTIPHASSTRSTDEAT